MLISAGDQELLARQAALQAEAGQVLAELDLSGLFADVGPVLVVGSYLSGLMVWRDLDVCLLAGVDCSPSDVLELLRSVWLRDLHAHVADWHARLRDTITGDQRLAVLRIKHVWHRLPSYPDQVSGWDIYTAVLRDDVRTPEQFPRWLAANGYPDGSRPSEA
jgi:hypothetical protein